MANAENDESDWIERVKKSVDSQNPTYLADKAEERHKELMEMLGGVFVQVSRMYDALVIALPDDKQQELLDAHETGGLLGDPPTLREDAWE